jgi:DNA-directed RNA polymerase specialized sigma24 family protein
MEPALAPRPPGTAKMSDESFLLRQALNAFSRDEQLVCIWKLAGLSSREIAQHHGRSAAAIDALFARAKRKLQRALREQEPSDGSDGQDSRGSPP